MAVILNEYEERAMMSTRDGLKPCTVATALYGDEGVWLELRDRDGHAVFAEFGADQAKALSERLARLSEKLKPTCKREGCPNPLAYPDAEYCGAACSELRKEPKT